MTAYYNEHDPFAAAWLRELIKEGHIAYGEVDARSIVDIRPSDLRGYTQCHFFAGIGVWSYALRRAGWPDTRSVWTMSCPCQPFSAAGKGDGFADERHLWPHAHHLISQCHPDVVFGEQVASKDGLAWLDLVQADLEGTGYASGAVDLCAAGVGAPHIRQRLYWIGERVAVNPRDGRRSGSRFEASRPQLSELGFGHGSESFRLADDNGSQQWSRRDAGSTQGQGLRAEPRGRDVAGGLADDELSSTARHGSNGWAGAPPCGLWGRPTDSREFERVAEHSGQGLEGRDARSMGVERQAFERDGRGKLADQSAAGPTNGFWRDADWLHCRDAKWRPVEPRPQQMVDGVACSLGRVRAGQIRDIEFEVAEWAVRYEADAGKALHDLRRSLPEIAEREREAGRLPDLHGAAFLLAFLRQLTEQGWAFSECVSGKSEEVSQDTLRVLRHLGSLARPSCERGLDRQQDGEHPDPMRVLSSILARHAQEAWGRAYDAYAALGFPLAHGSRSRVGRLRGYGNAIVAPLAQTFIEAYLDARYTIDLDEMLA